jgi:hypothetical protein
MLMKKILFSLFACSLALFAYTDADLDGVDDSVDLCPNTPITDIVDKNGCSVKSVITEHHFDIIMGLAYSQYNYRLNDDSDTITTSLQADWYYGNYSAQLFTSYYSTDGDGYDRDGMNDTTLAGYYTFKNVVPRLNLQVGAGVVFPTYDADYDNNNADFVASLNANYAMDEVNLFAGYSFTYVGDDDVRYTGTDGNTYEILYQNTNAFNAGAGYHFSPRLYASASYFYSDSIYEDVDAIENITLYGFYTIDAHWFLTGNYAYGLSDTTSDHYVALRVGYYF